MDLEPNPLIEGSGLVAVGFGGGGGIRGSQESKISRGGVLARTNSCAKIGNWWGINRHGWEAGFVVLMEGKISFKRLALFFYQVSIRHYLSCYKVQTRKKYLCGLSQKMITLI